MSRRAVRVFRRSIANLHLTALVVGVAAVGLPGWRVFYIGGGVPGAQGRMQAIEGIYQDVHVRLLETPKEISRSRVVVTFLDDKEGHAGNNASLSNLCEIIDDDLVAGSLEIRERFSRAIDKSEG